MVIFGSKGSNQVYSCRRAIFLQSKSLRIYFCFISVQLFRKTVEDIPPMVPHSSEGKEAENQGEVLRGCVRNLVPENLDLVPGFQFSPLS